MTAATRRARDSRTTTLVWAVLVLASLGAVAAGRLHLIDGRKSATTLVLGIAVMKVRLIGIHFMELRHAPVPLRAAFEAYCVGLFVVLISIYAAL